MEAEAAAERARIEAEAEAAVAKIAAEADLTAFFFYAGGVFALFPVLIMVLDCSLNARVSTLYNWRNLTGLLAGLGFYLLFHFFCDFRCTDSGISLHTDFSRIVGMSLPLRVRVLLQAVAKKAKRMC